MICSRYFLWFLFYSICGWIFECVYGVIVTGKWENRGFLHGPVVPIYGVGAVTITAVDSILLSHGVDLALWKVFIVSFLGSILLEYTTSWYLEKRFHAMWWDYSNMPFNIHGRVCLPASTAFGIVGVLVTEYSAPWLDRLTSGIPMQAVEGISLLAMAITAADTTLTVSALTRFEELVENVETDINSYMEHAVNNLQEKASLVGERLTEEKDRLFTERVEYILQHTSQSHLHALRRIRTIRYAPRVAGNLVLRQKQEYMKKAHALIRRAASIRKKS